ncbi:MAG: hypothetical protein WD738_13645 [Pirellulales bacterium]
MTQLSCRDGLKALLYSRKSQPGKEYRRMHVGLRTVGEGDKMFARAIASQFGSPALMLVST